MVFDLHTKVTGNECMVEDKSDVYRFGQSGTRRRRSHGHGALRLF